MEATREDFFEVPRKYDDEYERLLELELEEDFEHEYGAPRDDIVERLQNRVTVFDPKNQEIITPITEERIPFTENQEIITPITEERIPFTENTAKEKELKKHMGVMQRFKKSLKLDSGTTWETFTSTPFQRSIVKELGQFYCKRRCSTSNGLTDVKAEKW